jgi:hypothetical protein
MALPSNLSVASTIYDFDYAQRAVFNVAFPLCRAVYFDTAESLVVLTFSDGNGVVFYNVPRGKVYPLRCKIIVSSSGLDRGIALY